MRKRNYTVTIRMNKAEYLVYRTFLEEKKLWNKDSGRMYAHNIISWHKDEQITPEQAFEFGKEFAEKWFQGFQTLVAVHKDKDHIHCHLVTNSVSYEDGKKLHTTKKDLERMNSKLQIQVNQSSVEAFEQAQRKQEEAEKQARQAEYQTERVRKRADVEIQRARRKAKSEVEDMKERQFFWDWGYLCVIFFSLIQNGAFQRDILQLIMLPVNWCREYVIWFEQLDYMGYPSGEVTFERIVSMVAIMAGIVGCVLLVWGGIEQYRKIWDDIYKMVLIASISFIVVLGNLIREYLPFNLLFVILVINVGAVLIRIYLNNKNVGY